MNKLLYRVIFNKSRGLLMAVSELGSSHGAGTRGDAGQAVAPRMAMAPMNAIAFAVLALAGAQMFCMPVANAQIVADPSAPKTQQPVIVNTANGLPQVNIATPSAAGVSRNTYSQFDVNKPGAILNNARNDVQTQLGGWIQRNPNLANGTARIILNEVNSSNPSMLRGYVEVAGDRAQVIIANPSGVTCDGCGFINASRSTLTTGTPIMNNGSLDGYLVRGGVVTVQGDGMDASQSDFTDIIARAAHINAGIWSKELRVTVGSNRVDADNARADKQATADAAPAFGIDVAQLGGMYANKIVLVGTEAGVGMRNAGNIGAAAGEVRISADGLIENSGKIAGKQAVSITATGIDNRNAQLQSGADMSLNVGTGVIDNTGGLIESSAALKAQAASIINADTSASNQGLHGNTVSLDADAIDNRRGAILAKTSLETISAGTLDNSAGNISADNLSITDRNTATAVRTLAITNTGGKIQAGTALSIDSAALSGDGQLLSQQATEIKLTGDFTNTGTVRGDGTVSVVSAGTITNKNLLQAADSLNLTAATIANDATGTIVANTMRLNATDAHTLVNRGLIDGQDTFIDTQTLRNLGTGRIYGDHVAIAATTVDNEAETVNGVTSAPVIAARNRMDIGAATINNREHAMLFSGGDMAIGSALDSAHQATGQASTLNNNSATIEALGTLDLAAKTVNNTNEHFKTEIVEIGREWHREFQYSGSATRYDDSQIAIINDEADDMWVRDSNGNPSVKLGNDFNRYDFTRVITESRITETDPAKISAGGAMRITADTVNNDKSQIMAGGAINGTIGTLNNTEVPGQHIITDSGTAYHFYNIEKKGRDEQGVSTTGYYPGAVVQAISLTPTVYRQNMAVSGSGTQIATLANGRMNNLVTVPNNSLFSVNTNPAMGYLVQSDPRFTNYRNWLSSDYMLQQLNVDPSLTQKRLGDGFYEQKLVREQVAELTGKRFLDGYATDEAQYRALLDAGVTVAKQYNLNVGVALTAEQIAKLTTDVVLLVEKDVTLPDGTVTRALVPQLYVRLKDGDINGSGALLAAESINLQLSGDVNNSGTIAGRSLLSINAENINNIGGRITAKDAIVKASQDVNNLGGTIDAGDSLTVNAGRDLNLISTTSNSATDQATRTSVERVAALYVANPNATLVASAGRDITLNAAQIANSGAGGTTLLAAANNINFGTVTEKSTQSLTWDANNYRKEAMTNEVGSSLSASGDVRILAGNDINARGANISSEKGAIDLSAANNVNISTAIATQHVDEGHQTTGSSGMLSKKTVTTHDLLDQSQAQGSTISGNTVTVMAGNDLGVTGSNVVSTAGTRLGANNNVTISAASDNADSTHVRNEVTSGLFSGGGFGVTIGTQELDNKNRTISRTAVSSTVGSTDGNVSIVAGNAYSQTGSNVLAPKGDIDISAKKVDILAAIDSERNTQDMEFKQSGLTLQITSPVLSAIQTVQQMKKAAEGTSDARMQILAGAAAGLSVSNAADAITAGQGKSIGGKDNQILTGNKAPDGTLETRDANAADKVGGINLAISLGASKNESHSESNATTARSSTVSAGGNVNITAQGAGADSNIVVQGSDIKAGVNATLKADNEVQLLAAQNTSEQHSSNKGISGSIGISIGTDGLLFNAGVSGSRGRGDGNDVTQINTHVDAGNKLAIVSGGDTTLRGAVVSGNQVVMDVGTSGSGNLNIESLQDTSTYKDSQQSLGLSISVGMGKMSGSVNYSKSSTNSNYASVIEQSGVKAGDGGFQINVAGNTDLKGGVIASSDKAAIDGKNSLTTETLTQSDIKNSASYDAQSVGIGLGYSTSSGNSVGRDQKGDAQTGGAKVPGTDLPTTGKDGGFSATPPLAMSASGDSSSTTRSGISAGAITITNDQKQQQLTGQTADQTIAAVNRDVSSDKDGSNALKPIFDQKEIQNGFAIVGALTRELGTFLNNRAKEADEAKQKAEAALAEENAKPADQRDEARIRGLMDQYLDADKWSPNGEYRQYVTAIVGAAAGNVTGSASQFAQAAAVNYLQGLGAEQVKKIADSLDSEPARAALQGLLGCAGAVAKDGSCGAGALGASAGTVINSLLESTEGFSNAEREARKNLVTSLVAGIATAIGTGDVATSTTSAQLETENNALGNYARKLVSEMRQCSASPGAGCFDEIKKKTDQETANFNKRLTAACTGDSANLPACQQMVASVQSASMDLAWAKIYAKTDEQKEYISQKIAEQANDLLNQFDNLQALGAKASLLEQMLSSLSILIDSPGMLGSSINTVREKIANVKSKSMRPISEPVFRTNGEASIAAEALGYQRINEMIKGQAVFKKGNFYITRDIDGHNGGAWKMANSVENLGSKNSRLGTYDINLNRIGD
ncbi:hemagglutinin repeat-containing protein [Herbaspirillum sp.]|uniref:two-partner secretion domain-containing protein n=1 Tax=Herbaspirillum sp. TaxID=1890675 RepID=UPI0031DB24CD